MLFKTRPNGAHPGSGRAPLVDNEGRQIVVLEGPETGGGSGGAVIGAIVNPSANFSVPGSVVTYSIGDLIANSATAGSVAPMQHTITRTAAGAAAIVKCRFYKTGTGIVGASFRQHFFTSSPTVTNGDDGVFLPNQCLTRIGSIDYNLVDMVVHSDGVSCMGIPTSGYPITVDLPSGSVVYSLIEARGAYVRTAGETITTVAEVEQE